MSILPEDSARNRLSKSDILLYSLFFSIILIWRIIQYPTEIYTRVVHTSYDDNNPSHRRVFGSDIRFGYIFILQPVFYRRANVVTRASISSCDLPHLIFDAVYRVHVGVRVLVLSAVFWVVGLYEAVLSPRLNRSKRLLIFLTRNYWSRFFPTEWVIYYKMACNSVYASLVICYSVMNIVIVKIIEVTVLSTF